METLTVTEKKITVVEATEKQWVLFSGEWYLSGDLPQIEKKLPLGVYELNIGLKGPFLRLVQDKFILPKQLYGLETDMVDKVLTTFKHQSVTNLGVLFKGLKGTGKTITAKVICEKLRLPVILITNARAVSNEFLNSINQDIVLFFDEFEKVYHLYGDEDFDANSSDKPSIHHLLTLMDGIFTNPYKRLFLMTTNKVYLPSPMEARPSRIRYIKDFVDLEYEAIIEILTHELEKPYHIFIDNIVKTLSKYENITVDLIKCIAQEVNIYKRFDEELLINFNVKEPENVPGKLYKLTLDANGTITKEEYVADVKNVSHITEGAYLFGCIQNRHPNAVNGYVSDDIETEETDGGLRLRFSVNSTQDGDTIDYLVKSDPYIHRSFRHIL